MLSFYLFIALTNFDNPLAPVRTPTLVLLLCGLNPGQTPFFNHFGGFDFGGLDLPLTGFGLRGLNRPSRSGGPQRLGPVMSFAGGLVGLEIAGSLVRFPRGGGFGR